MPVVWEGVSRLSVRGKEGQSAPKENRSPVPKKGKGLVEGEERRHGGKKDDDRQKGEVPLPL